MLPDLLPIFPLPNVVLFPDVFLPLHIFEPRYRDMVADALAGERFIGMTLLRPGWEQEYGGRPPVFPVGCAGLITHADLLPDGRYNIVLRGIQRFRIAGEHDGRTYRRASVDALSETTGAEHATALRGIREKLEAMLMPLIDERSSRFPVAMGDGDLVHALAQYLDLDALERQALLERDGLVSRGRGLIELLEMRLLATKGPAPRTVH
ncbi:MAG: LON peptidase substrate-binding domain-containing protein [Vicinamibacterales bacterium]